MTIPAQPKIYHITHVDNLPGILKGRGLWSDAKMLELSLQNTVVGMSEIKRRRIEELLVTCHSSTTVGQYVPFYFCPRSVMLYILHCANHPDLTYRQGQRNALHLQYDMQEVVAWANQQQVRWAFTDRNAGTRYTDFFHNLSKLSELNWSAIQNRNFRDSEVKDGKQAEFLLHEFCPVQLVEKIGVYNKQVLEQVIEILNGSEYDMPVSIERSWYF